MVRYAAHQLASMVVLLLLSSILIYGSLYLAPGSPDAVLFGNHTVLPSVRAAVDAQYHLNRPFIVQYWDWLVAALHGDFGLSIALRTPVSGRITAAAPTTLFLVVYSTVLITLAGVGLGVLSVAFGRLGQQEERPQAARELLSFTVAHAAIVQLRRRYPDAFTTRPERDPAAPRTVIEAG